MEGFISKNRSNARVYYIRQCNRVKSKARIAYKISKKYKLGYSHKFHALNPGYILQKCKNWYHKNDVRVKPFVLGLHKINCTKLGNYYDTDPMEAIANIFL